MSEERMQDIVNALASQRDQALNALAMAQSEVAGLKREIAAMVAAQKQANDPQKVAE